MLNKSVVDFLKETSSSSPTPGGGSIAALVASLSVALSSMVVSLTLGKKNYENVQNDMQRLQIILDEYQKKTQDFVRQDIDAYNNVMAQYALPKLTEEEKKYRSQKIQEATIKAAYSPLKMAETVAELYEFIEEVMEKGNKNIYSDALISMILCHSAIESSLCNVIVNKNAIKDEKVKADLESKINELITFSSNKKNELMKKSHYFD